MNKLEEKKERDDYGFKKYEETSKNVCTSAAIYIIKPKFQLLDEVL